MNSAISILIWGYIQLCNMIKKDNRRVSLLFLNEIYIIFNVNIIYKDILGRNALINKISLCDVSPAITGDSYIKI